MSLDSMNFICIGSIACCLLLPLQLIDEILKDIALVHSFLKFFCPPSWRMNGGKKDLLKVFFVSMSSSELNWLGI